MPELPEVETIRRQLEPEVVGRRIESIEVLDPRWTEPCRPPSERAVAGRRIEALDRRGKWLLMGLERGVWLVMHLRMTGNLVLTDADEDRFLRVRIALDDGRRLLFTDARRFGTGMVVRARTSRTTCARASGSSRSPTRSRPTRSASSPRAARRR